jgi:hypothetical protein
LRRGAGKLDQQNWFHAAAGKLMLLSLVLHGAAHGDMPSSMLFCASRTTSSTGKRMVNPVAVSWKTPGWSVCALTAPLHAARRQSTFRNRMWRKSTTLLAAGPLVFLRLTHPFSAGKSL